MNTKPQSKKARGTWRDKTGSALLVTIVLTFVMGLVIASVIRNTDVEMRLNESHFLDIRARNGVEMVVDYGVAQLTRRWSMQTNFTDNELAPSNKPLRMHEELLTFLDRNRVDGGGAELIGGVVPPNTQFFIDPNDPANQFDMHKGKMVLARAVEIYGKAKISHSLNGRGYTEAYAEQTFQLRDAPIFSHAIFYNMDLEFHPGPRMDINGPVHTNGNLWAVSKGDLYFHSTVTAAGDFRVGMAREPYASLDDGLADWSGFGGESGQDGRRVYIKDGDEAWVNPYTGTGAYNMESSYYTSVRDDDVFTGAGFDNWRDFALNRWDGNLQSGDHGIPVQNPVGYESYHGDRDGSTEVENHSYALIEPNLPLSNPHHKGAGEDQKFARIANLIVKINVDENGDGVDDVTGASLDDHAVRLRSRPDRDDGWSSASQDYVNWHAIHANIDDIAAEEGWDEDEAEDFLDSLGEEPPHPSEFDTGYFATFYRLQRGSSTNPFSNPVTNSEERTYIDGDGVVHTYTATEVAETVIPINELFDHENSATDFDFESDQFEGAELRAQFDQVFAAHPFEEDGGIIESGMRDQRIHRHGDQAEANLSLIEMNISAFSENIVGGVEIDGEYREGYEVFEDVTGEEAYNGAVYVEFPTDPNWTPRSDNVLRSIENTGLLVTEGGGINPYTGRNQRPPDPDYNYNAANRDRGFTLATNNAMYLRGHFNADGNMDTPTGGNPMESDILGSPDLPAALAADAITVLSEAWELGRSSENRPAAANTEIAAAIATGLMPTNNHGEEVSSGGSHNFPRFLEDWGGSTLRYRGSLVALFESEIQSDPWSTAYYSPPRREWGFFEEFARGNYPPSFNVRSFRKLDFRFLTKSEYEARLAALPWSVTPQAFN